MINNGNCVVLKSRYLGKLLKYCINFCQLSHPTETQSHCAVRHLTSYENSRKTMVRSKKNKNKDKSHSGDGEPKQGNSNSRQKSGPSLQAKKRAPSIINIVVVGTGAPGSSRSLLVTTEHARYMFNCGEGTQRLAAMSKGLRMAAFAKLSGLENIFITHKSWENTGGLLGLAMTLEGNMNPESKVYVNREPGQASQSLHRQSSIVIHGPPGVEKIAMMTRKFAECTNINIIKARKPHSDASLTISPVPFYKKHSGGFDSNASGGEAPEAKRRRVENKSLSETCQAYAYICQPKPPQSKINVEKCLDAGITIGPMVGQLQRGYSVTLEDGRVVTPAQVTDDVDREKRPFLVVECPSVEFLPSLTDSRDIASRMEQTGDESFILVVHMTPAEVYNSEPYQAWMKRFSSSTNHLVMNESSGEADLMRVRVHQSMLNLVSNDVFPLSPAAQAESDPSKEFDPDHGQTVFASSGLHFAYRGKKLGFQLATDDFDYDKTRHSCLNIPGFSEQLAGLSGDNHENHESLTGAAASDNIPVKTKSINDENTTDLHNSYPKIVFLGTGSSEPNKIRGQSCVLVQLSKYNVILLDCGEDSYGQLHRFYGRAKAGRMLRKIKAIFVSHMHGDHHFGLFNLLKEREKAFISHGDEFSPVLLMAPIQMMRWLRFYHQELESVTHLFRFVKHQEEIPISTSDLNVTTATSADVRSELHLVEYTPVEVVHCNNAFGVSLKHRNDFKLVYSGDTRPCDKLVQAGCGCDLLIHEATHEDALIAHAKASKHSTFTEAMDVGKRMEAKHIILTHFSQRYAHMVPLFDLTMPKNVGIAFDNMQVCPRTFSKLPSFIPALTTIFSDKMHRYEMQRVKWSREQAQDEKDRAIDDGS